MIKYKSGRFSNIIMLIGVCLIGSAFHIHQLHPDYAMQDSNTLQHLSVDQPDCIACLHMMQAVPTTDDSGDTIRHDTRLISLLADQVSPVDNATNLNNKSPPVNC